MCYKEPALTAEDKDWDDEDAAYDSDVAEAMAAPASKAASVVRLHASGCLGLPTLGTAHGE